MRFRDFLSSVEQTDHDSKLRKEIIHTDETLRLSGTRRASRTEPSR